MLAHNFAASTMRFPGRLPLFLCILLLSGSILSCDSSGPEGPPPEFSVSPTSELSGIVDNTPGDFTWDFYQNNLEVTWAPEADWNGELVLFTFQIQNGEVVNRATTTAASTEGLDGDEATSGTLYPPGTSPELPAREWIPGTNWIPGSQWIPWSQWSPSEIEQVALDQVNLSSGQTMLVVYARAAGDVDSADQQTQPYGIVFEQTE